MAENKKPSGFKKFLNVLFNIFWAIFGGLGMAIGCICGGIATAVCIVPIFFGIPGVYFKMVPLAFAPAGKSVKLNFGSHPVKNVIYLLFGGLEIALASYLLGAVFCCTLIGIPLGLQQFKFAKYFLAPFGAQVLKNGENVLDKKGAQPAPAAAPAAAPAEAEAQPEQK